jgi:quinol monooxygenase YgiN
MATRCGAVAGVSLVSVIVVAGALFVDPAGREDYLAGCRRVVEQARAADGCVDFGSHQTSSILVG